VNLSVLRGSEVLNLMKFQGASAYVTGRRPALALGCQKLTSGSSGLAARNRCQSWSVIPIHYRTQFAALKASYRSSSR
jgi:hypothetical protein